MRLHEETEFKPKPLVRIGDMPILWHIMKLYSHYGHRDFILCLGYKGEMIKDYFLSFDELANDFTITLGSGPKQVTFHSKRKLVDDWRITFVDTGLETDTGGRVARIKPFIGEDETFFLTYGDGVANIDINKSLRYHKKKGTIVTLSGVNYVNAFGVIEPRAGLAKVFQEKPRSKAFINGGFFVVNRKFFDYLKDDVGKFEKEPLETLAKKDQLAVYAHHGFWYCVDTMKHLEDLNDMYKSGQRDWMVWDN